MNDVVRKVKPKELVKLNPIYMVANQERFLRERKARIKNRDVDIYVLEHDGMFIGEITVVYHHFMGKDYTVPGKRVYLEAFRVLDICRGKGYGQYLLNEVINKVREQGYSEITIGVEDDNENAKHIYSKYGFTELIKKERGDEYNPGEYSLYLKRF